VTFSGDLFQGIAKFIFAIDSNASGSKQKTSTAAPLKDKGCATRPPWTLQSAWAAKTSATPVVLGTAGMMV
jgi:hypothetical protein